MTSKLVDLNHLCLKLRYTQITKGTICPPPSKYSAGSAEHLAATAAQMLSIYCTLAPEPESQAALTQMLRDAPNCQNFGLAGKKAVMIHVDGSVFGESASRPHCRLPAMSEALHLACYYIFCCFLLFQTRFSHPDLKVLAPLIQSVRGLRS